MKLCRNCGRFNLFILFSLMQDQMQRTHRLLSTKCPLMSSYSAQNFATLQLVKHSFKFPFLCILPLTTLTTPVFQPQIFIFFLLLLVQGHVVDLVSQKQIQILCSMNLAILKWFCALKSNSVHRTFPTGGFNIYDLYDTKRKFF